MLRRRSKDKNIAMVNVKEFDSSKKEMEQANQSPQYESSQSEEDQHHSIRFLFLDFCSYTSGHGPGRMVASKYWIMKIFWFLLFVAALVVASIQIDALFEKFKKRPLTTHVSIQHETSLNFPSITICNFNALRKDALGDAAQGLRDSFETIENETLNFDYETERERKRRAVKEPYPEDDFDDRGTSLEDFSEEDEEGIENPDALDLEFKHKEQFLNIMAQEGPQELIPLGHQFEDLILSCTYRGISCDNFTSSFWSGFWHYSYGNCYVFNAGKSDKGQKPMILKSNKPGPSHGLVLEINIEQNQYIGAFTEEAGVKVDISNQGEMPFPREKGLSASPGFAASIGMRKVEINRKDPFNNNRCRNTESLDDSNLYNQFGVNYSSTACKESCLALNQRKSCNCMEHRFPIPSRATPVCDIFNKTVVDCLSRVQRDFKTNKLNCSKACPPPCKENIFKVTTSFSSWPSKSNEPFYLSKLEKKEKLVDNGNNISLNFLQLNIFYEELNFELIKEERSYELANFVSDIGGTLGLWIGMSVLSFAEILEVLLLIGNELIRKCLKKKSSSGKVQSRTSLNF